MDIGIDLGTTYSVMAVKGNVNMAPGMPPGRYLGEEGMDVTILPDEVGNLTFPSVLWWEPNPDYPKDPTKGTYAFGADAKQKADEGATPITCSKRSIGTNEVLHLNGRAFTAKEVATHFLRHLKQHAEKVLGEKIGRVVITHPAYFEPAAREETLQAARDAGFKLTPDQLMMEPCAAALAYTINDPRGIEPGDALRVLAYDLGGGTFDVAVMEKIGGVIQMKKFEGDHLLGGSDFDKTLVRWVLDQLKAQGRVIPYDENNPEHTGRRARMLQVAERVKEQLTEQRTAKIKVPIKMNFLVDDKGQSVQVPLSINREEYAALIQEDLNKTIDACRRALAAVNLTPDQLHTVLLVGGSSYGQWVQELVRSEFNVEVRMFSPDLCVGAGAALMVAQLPPPPSEHPRVELKLDYQPTSALLNVTVTGSLRPVAGSGTTAETCARMELRLLDATGDLVQAAAVGAEGTFVFENVSLDDGQPTAFTVEVKENGESLLRHDFTITYHDVPPPPPPIPVLPRPLYLKAETIVPIAEEGAPLPAKREVRLKTAFDITPDLDIPILLDNEEVGRIAFPDIPQQVVAGCAVVVEVEVTQSNEMRGKVKLYGTHGNVVKEVPVHITFPPIEIPERAVLVGQFEDLKDKLEQDLLMGAAQDRARLAGPGKALVREIEKVLSEEQPDRQKLNDKIKKLHRLLHPPVDDMEPPRAQFEGDMATCRELIREGGNDPSIKSIALQLDSVEQLGRDASTTKNHKKWATATAALAKIKKDLEGEAPPSSGKLPATPVLKMHAEKLIEELQSRLQQVEGVRRKAGDLPRWQAIIDDTAQKLNRVRSGIQAISDDIESDDAMAKLRALLAPRVQLERDVKNIEAGTRVLTS